MKRSAFFALALVIGFSSCKKDDENLIDDTGDVQKTYRITVTDENGATQQMATVKTYNSEEDLRNDTLETASYQTDSEGKIVLADSLELPVFAKAELGEFTSEFTTSTFTIERTEELVDYQLQLAETTPMQRLCGHGSKDWLMTEYILNGNAQPYEVLSALHDDGTWTDSNDRSGTWSFGTDFTTINYDYTGSGLEVAFDIVTLTSDTAHFEAEQFGMSIELIMTAF